MYLWFFHYPPPAPPQRTCCFHSFHLRVESSQETTVSQLCLCLSTSICLSVIMSCYFDTHSPSAFTASILGVDSTWDVSRKKYLYCLCACMFIYICICFCTGCTVYQHDTTLMSNAYDASPASIVGVKTSWETTSRQPTAGEARGGRLFSKSTIRFPLTSKDLEAFCIILSYISFLYEMSLSFLIDQICSKSKLLFETHPRFVWRLSLLILVAW